jgi:uncharacterized protein YqhQ
VVGLVETFYLGIKGIFFSADAVMEEEEQFTYKELAVVIALALGVASLFFVGPYLLTALLGITGILFNVFEAIVRLGIFLSYLVLVGLWGDFRRVFQYHGAEHKTINAYEAGVSLDVESVKKFPRFHPRCGVSFIFIVVIVSIILFSIMPDLGFMARLSYRVLLIPVIGAISYELLKLSGRYKDSIIMRILTVPGLVFQRLTTREPDDDMLEVAIKALKEVRKLSVS